jgi:hypothetical protein
VIVVVSAAAGVVSSLWSFERIRCLGAMRFRGAQLVWVAAAIQVLIFTAPSRQLPASVVEIGHYASYALCIGFIVVNRDLPGTWLIALGTTSNLLAIVANRGTMPADISAWLRAGRPIPAEGHFGNSEPLTNPHLGFLGDVFAIPAGWPLSNVFSVGDVVIVIGATYLAHGVCARGRSVPTERFELSLTRT